MYVDGFVLAIKKDRVDEYKAITDMAGRIWMEYGALTYVECVGDDTPYGEKTSFPRAVMATDDEVVVFSWITYKSREDRDAINKKVMADPRMECDPATTPFDAKRMIFGGFKPLTEMSG